MKANILKKLSEIKLFLFDLDGVLIHKDNFTEEDQDKFFSLVETVCSKLSMQNKKIGIVTARDEDQFVARLREILKCGVISSSIEKVTSVDKLVNQLSLDYNEVFYAGDDILDIPLLKKCGLSAAPSNARREVKRIVDFTLKSNSASGIFSELFSIVNKE
jgi:3-deoxy-D-manno-octulosonate 8-phosphate phosphatase (KDO 8-P phosphatase)